MPLHPIILAGLLIWLLLWPLQASATERIGIYSGTFDPPHLGHQTLLELAYGQLRLERIYLLPNYSPGHKLVSYQKLPKAGENRHVVVIDRPGYQAIKTAETEQLTRYGQIIWLAGELPAGVRRFICQHSLYLEAQQCQPRLYYSP